MKQAEALRKHMTKRGGHVCTFALSPLHEASDTFQFGALETIIILHTPPAHPSTALHSFYLSVAQPDVTVL